MKNGNGACEPTFCDEKTFPLQLEVCDFHPWKLEPRLVEIFDNSNFFPVPSGFSYQGCTVKGG